MKRHISLRVRQDDLARIDQLAEQHHQDRTAYMVTMALGEIPAAKTEAIERIEALEADVQRLQRAYELAQQASW